MERSDLRKQADEAMCDVGVDQFNVEHRELLYNMLLLQHCLEGVETPDGSADDWKTIHASVRFLDRYAKEHLVSEEAAMRASHYEGYQAHKALHDQIVAKLEALKDQIETERTLASVRRLNAFLLEWIFQHTSHVDMEYKGKLNVGTPP